MRRALSRCPCPRRQRAVERGMFRFGYSDLFIYIALLMKMQLGNKYTLPGKNKNYY
jgi:hypothetical protein